MPWVRFTKDFDFHMTIHCVRAYKAGMVCLVSQACAEKVVADGSAELTERHIVKQEADAIR